MLHKTAYIWGPVSCFSGELAAYLVQKGWHVHIATKSAFQFSLAPLDLRSTAQENVWKAFNDREKARIFEERVRFVDATELVKGTKYDALIFCGLPPNYDEDRVSRAPWAAEDFGEVAKRFKDTPVFIVSSLWGAVQNDGVVPEEIEATRRKPVSRFEAVCQQYEMRLLKQLDKVNEWYVVRLPMLSGSTVDGHLCNFSGPMTLYERLETAVEQHHKEKTNTLTLAYNPDATMWFSPVDVAVNLFSRLLEDDQRPRITNLVSTQATLNQEWLQHLAKALGFHKAVHGETDPCPIPTVLRRALNDSVLVKTRGLFEVMGRYQQVPTVIDTEYFERCLMFGRNENWGKLIQKNGKPKELPNYDHIAREYFTRFVPEHLTAKAVKEVTADGAGIGFCVDGKHDLSWVVRDENGHVVVNHLNGNNPAPKVKFEFTSNGMVRLIQRKVSLERALVSRDAKVDGNPLEVLKACSFFKRFLKEHPYKIEAGESEWELQKT